MFALSPRYNQLGESVCAKSKRDACGASERGNVLSPSKGLVLCSCLQGLLVSRVQQGQVGISHDHNVPIYTHVK